MTIESVWTATLATLSASPAAAAIRAMPSLYFAMLSGLRKPGPVESSARPRTVSGRPSV
jgi:hypothetical protein